MTLAIFCPAETRWKFYNGNQSSRVGRDIIANFYTESVQVGCKTITLSTAFINLGWKLQLNPIAPPKSYPISTTFFLELNPKC